ncbi:PDZ domain-containing protein [bacterium]|nr:PDZ domain-containing protein [bacterium]
MRRFVLVSLLVFLCSQAFALDVLNVGDLRVSINSGGKWLPFYRESRPPKRFLNWNFSKIFDIQVRTGEEYYIRLENTSPFAVGVYVYVDGLNTIGREPGGGSWWYLEPHQSFDLAGWQLDNEYRANFEFVDLGSPSGQGGKYPGWIFIAQYRVVMPKPQPVRRYGYDMSFEMEERSAPESKSAVVSSGAETGAGQVVQHNVRDIYRELEATPTGLVAIHYSKEKPKVVQPHCERWLGIDALSNIDDGVYVSNVYPNSPAAMAGLERGDVILSFDGVRVRYRAELHELVNKCYGGQRVILEVKNVRDKRIYDVTAYIGCR